ncbi:uncharacterized protein [Temnothorax longispinosus]|uniref:uncharacterized protein n=1 Tax=Temnothorax longispinosus TaxID=300112 RepID=UPI003A99CC9D
MPSCVVTGCTSGYGSNPEHVHFFTIPKNPESKKLWKTAIRRTDSFVKSSRAVCEKHFRKEQIMWKRELLDPTGRVLGVTQYKIPRLIPGSVPSIFSWDEVIKSDQSDKVITTEPAETPPAKFQKLESSNEQIDVDADKTVVSSVQIDKVSSVSFTEVYNVIRTGELKEAAANTSDARVPMRLAELSTGELSLPSRWIMQSMQSSKSEGSKLLIVFTLESVKIDEHFQTFISKAVTVTEDLSVEINVYGQPLNPINFDVPCRVTSIECLQDIIFTIDRLHICTGCNGSAVEQEMQRLHCRTVKKDFTGSWRHINCIGLLSNTTVCQFCRTAKKSIANILRRLNKSKSQKIQATTFTEKKMLWLKLQSKCRKALQAKRQSRKKVKTLKSELQDIRSQMARLTTSDLEKHVQDGNIPQNQLHTLSQIIDAAKRKNSKGRKYSEEWILLCMLMHMRSASGYEFLRSNEILPLPCVRTIRRYLSKIDSTCGFDPQFFEVLKVALNKKEESLRHGILLLDEMSTRESVSVATKNLTYKGLIDFGSGEERSTNFTEKADHALVIMYQTLNDSYAQPIAVFASKGPVKGDVLAKLIIKAISLMEKIGAKIHGVVSDGASTNRKFWTVLGVNASKDNLRNYFEHPLVEGRKVYVFSDTPHLMKTIRNRLYNNKVLQTHFSEPVIKWEYIEKLHDVDIKSAGPGQALYCPKLSKNHFDLNNSLKMRVRLAVQVFSNSVAKGLRFYKGREPELQDCEPTANFCKWMNDMFDALNRTNPIDGVTPGNSDFEVIEESLKKLDAWEKQVREKKLSNDLFLTKPTAEGLRVTLKSMLDLITYLTEHCGFSYVLTGRINQDPLEVCMYTGHQAYKILV